MAVAALGGIAGVPAAAAQATEPAAHHPVAQSVALQTVALSGVTVAATSAPRPPAHHHKVLALNPTGPFRICLQGRDIGAWFRQDQVGGSIKGWRPCSGSRLWLHISQGQADPPDGPFFGLWETHGGGHYLAVSNDCRHVKLKDHREATGTVWFTYVTDRHLWLVPKHCNVPGVYSKSLGSDGRHFTDWHIMRRSRGGGWFTKISLIPVNTNARRALTRMGVRLPS